MSREGRAQALLNRQPWMRYVVTLEEILENYLDFWDVDDGYLGAWLQDLCAMRNQMHVIDSLPESVRFELNYSVSGCIDYNRLVMLTRQQASEEDLLRIVRSWSDGTWEPTLK